MSNWASHVSGLGPSFKKIWTCGSSPRSEPRNAWTPIKNVNGDSRLRNFWNFFGAIQMISCRARLVTMDETWLYIFFWIKTASSSLIIFQRAKLSTRSITHLCWCNWTTFWRKNAAGRECHEGSPGIATQKKLAYLGFQCLDHPPYSPDLAPSDYQLFPGLKK